MSDTFTIDFSGVVLPDDDSWYLPMLIAGARPDVWKVTESGRLVLRLVHPELGEVRKYVPLTGHDHQGKPRSRHAVELLRAVGHSPMFIQRAIDARSVNVEKLAALVEGRVVLVELTLDMYNGREHVVARRLLPATATRSPKGWQPSGDPPEWNVRPDAEPITLTIAPSARPPTVVGDVDSDSEDDA